MNNNREIMKEMHEEFARDERFTKLRLATKKCVGNAAEKTDHYKFYPDEVEVILELLDWYEKGNK